MAAPLVVTCDSVRPWDKLLGETQARLAVDDSRFASRGSFTRHVQPHVRTTGPQPIGIRFVRNKTRSRHTPIPRSCLESLDRNQRTYKGRAAGHSRKFSTKPGAHWYCAVPRPQGIQRAQTSFTASLQPRDNRTAPDDHPGCDCVSVHSAHHGRRRAGLGARSAVELVSGNRRRVLRSNTEHPGHPKPCRQPDWGTSRPFNEYRGPVRHPHASTLRANRTDVSCWWFSAFGGPAASRTCSCCGTSPWPGCPC